MTTYVFMTTQRIVLTTTAVERSRFEQLNLCLRQDRLCLGLNP